MIIRRKHTRNFTTIPNELWRDERLSVEAKGLQGFLLSLPHDWEVSISHLSSWAKWGRDKTRRVVNELVDNGWIIRERIRAGETKKFTGVSYIVRDEPSKDATSCEPQPEKPSVAEPQPEKPAPEKPALANQPLQKKDSYKRNKKEKTRARAGSPIVIEPASHPDQWKAWRSHFVAEKKKFSLILMDAAEMCGDGRGLTVASEWPTQQGESQ